MSAWLKILRIASDLSAVEIEAQALRIVNETAPLTDGECMRLAAALQAEIERRQVELGMPSVARGMRPEAPDDSHGASMTASHRSRSADDAAVEELSRLARMLDEVRSIFESR